MAPAEPEQQQDQRGTADDQEQDAAGHRPVINTTCTGIGRQLGSDARQGANGVLHRRRRVGGPVGRDGHVWVTGCADHRQGAVPAAAVLGRQHVHTEQASQDGRKQCQTGSRRQQLHLPLSPPHETSVPSPASEFPPESARERCSGRSHA